MGDLDENALISTTRSEPGSWTLILSSQGHSWLGMTERASLALSKQHMPCRRGWGEGGDRGGSCADRGVEPSKFNCLCDLCQDSRNVELGVRLNNDLQVPLPSLKFTSNSRRGTSTSTLCVTGFCVIFSKQLVCNLPCGMYRQNTPVSWITKSWSHSY